MGRHLRLVKVDGGATEEQVAAITAAIAAVEASAPSVEVDVHNPDHLDLWVQASRRSAQRAALQRGPWRLSGRLGRRFRA